MAGTSRVRFQQLSESRGSLRLWPLQGLDTLTTDMLDKSDRRLILCDRLARLREADRHIGEERGNDYCDTVR